jgi:polysaccharide biosynthesis/export protein
MKKVYTYILLPVIALLLTNCSQKRHITYYQNIEQVKNIENATFEPTLQTDDLLLITVSAPDPEAAAPFNLEVITAPSALGQSNQAGRQMQLYLVDSDGVISFPVLGELKVHGLNKKSFQKLLVDKLKKYIKDPIVNIRIVNFKVTVQGEVQKPGSFNIASERITLPEALSMAGDLTIYGKRDNIIVIREVDGKKMFQKIDITKSDFINSPYYYLAQNDLIYVEPNNAKSNSSTFNQNTSVWIAIASLVSSAVLSILLINKN